MKSGTVRGDRWNKVHDALKVYTKVRTKSS